VAPNLRYTYQGSGVQDGSREVPYAAVFDTAHLASHIGARCVLPEDRVLADLRSMEHLIVARERATAGEREANRWCPYSPLLSRVGIRNQISLVRDIVGPNNQTVLVKHAWLNSSDFTGALARAVSRHAGTSTLLVLHLRQLGASSLLPAGFDWWSIGPSHSAHGAPSRIPKPIRDGVAGLRFARHVRQAAKLVLHRWQLGNGTAWAAVHWRRGNLFACREKCVQTAADVRTAVWEAERLVQCQHDGSTRLNALAVSTTTVGREEEIGALRRALPGVRLLAFDETLWESLDLSSVPDWPVNEAAYDVLRDAIEVQVWLHAPVFIASRSSMSELNMLKRDPNCTLYMGPREGLNRDLIAS